MTVKTTGKAQSISALHLHKIMNHGFTHPYARPSDNSSPPRQSFSQSPSHPHSPQRHAEGALASHAESSHQPLPLQQPQQPQQSQQEPEQYRQLDRVLAQRYMEYVIARRRRAVQVREGGEAPVLRPRMEICDAPSTPHITALFEIPGLRKDQIHVHLTPEGRLTISGERRAPPLLHNSTDPTLPRYPVCEIKYGKYERTVEVPRGLEVKDITASLTDGLLSVSWPRVSPTSTSVPSTSAGAFATASTLDTPSSGTSSLPSPHSLSGTGPIISTQPPQVGPPPRQTFAGFGNPGPAPPAQQFRFPPPQPPRQ